MNKRTAGKGRGSKKRQKEKGKSEEFSSHLGPMELEHVKQSGDSLLFFTDRNRKKREEKKTSTPVAGRFYVFSTVSPHVQNACHLSLIVNPKRERQVCLFLVQKCWIKESETL